jgi:hypothetical protein
LIVGSHQPGVQSFGSTKPVGRHTLATGSHHSPHAQSAWLTAGDAMVTKDSEANPAAATVAIRRTVFRMELFLPNGGHLKRVIIEDLKRTPSSAPG